MDKLIYTLLGSLAAVTLFFVNDAGLALVAVTTGLLFKWETE